jgi:hypothetical protein
VITLKRWEWIVVFVVDAALKSGYVVLFSFTLFMIPFALILSATHFVSFFVASKFVNGSAFFRAWKFATALALANVLFAFVYASYRMWSANSARLTECFGVERTCSWVEGGITGFGLRILFVQIAIYVALNLTSFLPLLLPRIVLETPKKPR